MQRSEGFDTASYAYAEPQWRLQGFAAFALAPFGKEQWTPFIRWYYGGLMQSYGLAETEARDLAENLISELADGRHAHLLKLAERPLLLTLMTDQYAKRRGRLPDSRAELYENSVEQLLGKWQRARIEIYRQDRQAEQKRMLELLDADQKTLRERLQRLAFESHREQQDGKRGQDTADIARTRLVGMFEPLMNKGYLPELIVDYLAKETGLLYARDDARTFAFAHRTFQEYLAACHITDSGLLDDPEAAAASIYSDLGWWREVVLLAVGRARFGGDSAALHTITRLLPHALDEVRKTGEPAEHEWYAALLAGHALDEQARQGGLVDKPTYQRLRERCVGWLTPLVVEGLLAPPIRAEAGDVLGWLGDPRPGAVAPFITQQGEHLPQLAMVYIPDTNQVRSRKIKRDGFCLGYTPSEHAKLQKRKLNWQPRKNEHWPDEQGVNIEGFWLAAYPITVAQYAVFVENNGSPPMSWDKQQRHPNQPVVWVDWYEAVAYCNWLTEKLRDLPGYEEVVVRLPTEREWEWAARGPHRRHWPWGDEWQVGAANHDQSGIGRPCAVGSFPLSHNWVATSRTPPTPFVAADTVDDLAGNVWEWCSTKWRDSYADYPERDGRDEWTDQYLAGDDGRVIRGGCFANNFNALRGAYRGEYYPDPDGYVDQGFRCCAPILPDSDS